MTPPRYDADQLLGIVPVDYKQPYDAREVVARIVDDSQFLEFKPAYGPTVLCLQAHVFGIACHILANNGPIDPNGATKAAQFIQLADQSDTPLIFLNNITGYMVGLAYEQAGMIKHGSKMIQAVSTARVPKVTLYIGASFGAGNYGMCGLAYEPDFLFAWPCDDGRYGRRTSCQDYDTGDDTSCVEARARAGRRQTCSTRTAIDPTLRLSVGRFLHFRTIVG